MNPLKNPNWSQDEWTSFLRENRSGDQNTELKTWRHVVKIPVLLIHYYSWHTSFHWISR